MYVQTDCVNVLFWFYWSFFMGINIYAIVLSALMRPTGPDFEFLPTPMALI